MAMQIHKKDCSLVFVGLFKLFLTPYFDHPIDILELLNCRIRKMKAQGILFVFMNAIGYKDYNKMPRSGSRLIKTEFLIFMLNLLFKQHTL